MIWRRWGTFLLLIFLSFACSLPVFPVDVSKNNSDAAERNAPTEQQKPTHTVVIQGGSISDHETELIQPEDLVYQGAFRLPGDTPDEIGWLYGGEGLAYYPDGDPDGDQDGFPGSLFGIGHQWNQYVTEISIPVPVNSTVKNLEELNTAVTLQPFNNIFGDVFGDLYIEIPRAGLEYLPAQSGQTSGKLYFCRANHLDEGEKKPTHGWAEVDLTSPDPAGIWVIDDQVNYVTSDYLFEVPQDWADAYTGGRSLATGRYRDGGQGSQGPSLFAIAPWQDGNPPQNGARLSAITLLLYSDVTVEDGNGLEGYSHADEWTGGAWLTIGEKSALVFAGTKALGETWYGWRDGTQWPNAANREGEGARGWWADSFQAQFLFYNPDDLAAVVQGQLQPSDPQPYAVLTFEDRLYNGEDNQALFRMGALAYDRQNGFLYLLETFADGDQPVVHVWQLES